MDARRTVHRARRGESRKRRHGAPTDARVARSREAVLRAVLEVLAERGSAGCTMEAVACHAGVAKTTVYRHWGSLGPLLVDAMESLIEQPATPNSGDLRADMFDLLRRLRDTLWRSSAGAAMPALLDLADADPDFRVRCQDFLAERRLPLRTVLELAQGRGELSRNLDLELTIDRLGGPLFYRRLVRREEMSDDEIGVHLDATLVGLILGAAD